MSNENLKRNVFYFPNNVPVKEILEKVERYHGVSTTSKLMQKLLFIEAKRIGYKVTNIVIDFNNKGVCKSIKKPFDFMIGYNESGEESILNFNTIKELHIEGESGVGKTSIVHNIIYSLQYNSIGDTKFTIFDSFGNYSKFKDRVNFDIFEGDIKSEDISNIVSDLKNNGNTHIKNIFIFDEIRQQGENIFQDLRDLFQIGRIMGVYIVIVSQNGDLISNIQSDTYTKIKFDISGNFYIE